MPPPIPRQLRFDRRLIKLTVKLVRARVSAPLTEDEKQLTREAGVRPDRALQALRYLAKFYKVWLVAALQITPKQSIPPVPLGKSPVPTAEQIELLRAELEANEAINEAKQHIKEAEFEARKPIPYKSEESMGQFLRAKGLQSDSEWQSILNRPD